MTLVRESVLPWYKGEGEKMGNTFVLLYVHLENDLFYISFSSTLYQGSTLTLTNAITYPHCFFVVVFCWLAA